MSRGLRNAKPRASHLTPQGHTHKGHRQALIPRNIFADGRRTHTFIHHTKGLRPDDCVSVRYVQEKVYDDQGPKSTDAAASQHNTAQHSMDEGYAQAPGG